jgi:hypothetical protein
MMQGDNVTRVLNNRRPRRPIPGFVRPHPIHAQQIQQSQQSMMPRDAHDQKISSVAELMHRLTLQPTATTKAPTISKTVAKPAAAATAAEAKTIKGGKGDTGGMGVLSAGGEVVGVDDFQSGTIVVALPDAKQPVSTGPYRLLKDWRPLADVVPDWQFYVKSHPDIQTMFVLDCGAGGDCMFSSIAAGYNQLFQSLVHHMQSMRNMAADEVASLTEHEVDEFLIDLLGRLPTKDKQMSAVDKVKMLQAIIRQPGNAYWGETGALRMLFLRSKPFAQHHLGFMVINIRKKPVEFRPLTEEEKKTYQLHKRRLPTNGIPTRWEPRPELTPIRRADTKLLMLLHCLNNSHWVLVGYAPNALEGTTVRIGSTFPVDSFPKPLVPFLKD